MSSLDLSQYDIEFLDDRELVTKLNNMMAAVQAAVNAVSLGVYNIQGFHDASTGSYPAGPSANDSYVISVAGTISGTAYEVGDTIVYDGSSWILVLRFFDRTKPGEIGGTTPGAITGTTGQFTSMGIGRAPLYDFDLYEDQPDLNIESSNGIDASVSTEKIGDIVWRGHKATTRRAVARIRARADGTWSTVTEFNAPTALEFYTQDASGTEVTSPHWTLDKDGHWVAASGKAIDYTAAGGGKLDYYDEEVSWTPAVANVTATYNSRSASATIIGDVVEGEVEIDFASLDNTDPSGWSITGLPVAAAGSSPVEIAIDGLNTTIFADPSVVLNGSATAGGTGINFGVSSGGVLVYNNATVQASGVLKFRFRYRKA